MNAPRQNSSRRGFSVLELLIVIAMISALVGFALVNVVQGRRALSRSNTALEIALNLQKARLDSIRRNVKTVDEMAQVKVFNRRFYSIAVDGDGDGNLDIPLVMNLPEAEGVEIRGPFPKTFIFDRLGQTVDADNNRVPMDSLIIANSSGASVIAISETGKPVVSTLKD